MKGEMSIDDAINVCKARGTNNPVLRRQQWLQMNCLPSITPRAISAFALGRSDTGFPIVELMSSSTATALCGFGALCLTVTWQLVRSRRGLPMDSEVRKNRDFSKGPVWDPDRSRWLVEIRYPDRSRLRRRFRREREALRAWSGEESKIENGTWNDQVAKNITFASALGQYREYSKIQNRSHASYVEPPLKMWERELNSNQLLARVTAGQIEAIKLRRAETVKHTTADKDLGVLKAFFNWCMDRGLAVNNPVCKVKFFHATNERVRYLTDEEWERLCAAALRHQHQSPYLLDKMVLARNTGLRSANLFRSRWGWVDWLTRVLRVPRTKNNQAHAVPLNNTAYETLKRVYAERDSEFDSPYVFVHARDSRHAGKPVLDVKTAFHTALHDADIVDFTWHDFRHDYASRLVMAGVSLRAVAELLGHKGLRMVMRYAHLSPGFLSEEVKKLDTFSLTTRCVERARKGQRVAKGRRAARKW
jgi:integrase